MSTLSIIGASAGSGKTHRIVLEFLKLILPNKKNIKHILAITFTNKAAEEMKHRVIEELSLLAERPNESKMKDDLCKSLNLEEPILIEKAKSTLNYILHHYSDISISTIDAFMQTIIRSFARDLELAPDYEVTVDDDEMNKYVISSIIDNANQNTDLTKVFKLIIENKLAKDSLTTNFDDEFNEILTNISKEKNVNTINDITKVEISDMISSMDALNGKIKDLRNSIDSTITDFNNILQKNSLSILSFNTSRNISVYSEIEKIKKEKHKYKSGKTIEKIIESKKILITRDENLEKHIADIYEKLKEIIAELKYAFIISQYFPTVILAGAMWNIRNSFIANNNILPVADFNKKISKVISSEPVPFIYLRAGNRYHNIMIDEFQDTSEMQWTNLLPLIHNSLSENNTSRLVGDPKQSIYRWRNGKMEIMLSLQQLETNQSNAAHQINSKDINLFKGSLAAETIKSNFRSDKNIVEFNNEFFKFLNKNFLKTTGDNGANIKNPLYLTIYEEENVVQQNEKKEDTGYVEAHFFEKADLEKKLKNIKDIIIKKEEEGFKKQDITILCRGKISAIAISQFLINDGTAVVSEETMQIGNSIHCRLAMSVFRFINNQNDKINAAEMRNLLSTYTQNDKFYDSENNNYKTFFEKYPKLESSNTKYMSSGEIFENIVKSLGLNETGKYYITFLRESIAEIQTGKENNAEAIWKWWIEKGQNKTVITPQNENAIKIMTIHKSKGLQFPIVILPDINFSDATKLHKDLHWIKVDKEKWHITNSAIHLTKDLPTQDLRDIYETEREKAYIDTINLMYVACTRAEKQLFFLTENTSSDGNAAILLKRFIENSEKFEKESEENLTIYKFGKSENKQQKQTKKTENYTINKFFINTSSKYGEEDLTNWDNKEMRLSSKQGTIWHQILSNINKDSNIETIINQNIANGNISSKNKNNYLAFTKDLRDKYPEIFPEKKFIKNEFEITDSNNNILRPDRLIKLENRAFHLLDFKSGTKLNINKHKSQICEYASILESMGLKIEKKSLLYINLDTNSSELINV